MSKLDKFSGQYFRILILILTCVVVLVMIGLYHDTAGNVLMVLLGFGAVILVHEFGHFTVAKLSGIKVEAFSIFMPPILLGIQRKENGIRIRILPEIIPKDGDESGEGALSFTIGRKGIASETEYRIGLIPFGGFVKMLGQDDIGSVKDSNDPRSFANKPALVRAGVLAAGVTFNVISAGIIFMIAFLHGINLPPAVVGGVVADSPAARAGLRAGDEVIEIAGDTRDLDFSNIGIAAALSGKNEEVHLTIRRTDGTEEELTLIAEELPDGTMRVFGISPPQTLTVAKFSKEDENKNLFEKSGLRPGDRIKAINGIEVQNQWELRRIVKDVFVPEIELLVERTNPDKEVSLVKSKIDLALSPTMIIDASESTFGSIYSLVPRLKISDVSDVKVADGSASSLEPDDVILQIGDIKNPTYEQMREVVAGYESKELPVKVLRTAENGQEYTTEVSVIPKRQEDGDKVIIGVSFYHGNAYDFKHAVIAATVASQEGVEPLDIPSGATITAVDGTPVNNFYDIAREVKKYPGQRITIEYRVNEEEAGSVFYNVSGDENFVPVQTTFSLYIPFENLERLYKADGPVDALVMGYRKTIMFIAQAYVTLRRVVGGLVSPENLMGPVGIITFSYRIVAERPWVHYVYFLGLINAVIAVFNFLPLPPLDGGLVLLLIIEKIKGAALSERIQAIVAYAGWALILALILYVTFNDIKRSFL